MDPLFSHAPQPHVEAQQARGRDDVLTVTLPAPQDVVYGAFTGDLHLWWPAEQTVFGVGTHPAIEGDVVGEESEDGRVALWARVVEEDQPHRLVLDWHLGGDPARPSRVTAEFEPAGDGTAVLLRAETAVAAGGEEEGVVLDWAVVVGRFAAFFGVPSDRILRS